MRSQRLATSVFAFALLLLAGPARSQLAINEVLYDPMGADSGNQRIELINESAGRLDIAGFVLCVQFQYWAIPAGASIPGGGVVVIHVNESGTDTATEFYTGVFTDLQPQDSVSFYVPGTRGIGFTDPANIVDYVGWGAGGQAREGVAVLAGIWGMGEFVPGVAEGSSVEHDGPGDGPSFWCEETSPSIGSPNDGCAAGGGELVINEVLYDPMGADTGNQRIELANPGAAAFDLTGYVLCVQFQYWTVPAAVSIPAGGVVVVHVNESGVDTPTDLFTGLLTDLQAQDSVAFYLPGTRGIGFTDPANIVDYVQWGAGGQAREDVAVNAGIWPRGEFVPGVAEGSSIEHDGPGDDPSFWCEETSPTIGSPNDGCAGGPTDQIEINEILYDPVGADTGNQRVEIRNGGVAAFDAGGYSLCIAPPFYFDLPPGIPMNPGDIIVVHINEDGVDTATEFYTGSGFTDLTTDAGSFGIYIPGTRGAGFADPANIVDFVQWGAGGQAREDVAVGAGIWMMGDFVPDVPEGSSIEFNGPGDGSAFWCEEPAPNIGLPNDGCVLLPAPLEINEVLIDPLGPDSGLQRVEIRNAGASMVDAGSYNLCVGPPFYYQLPPNIMMAPDDLIVVHVNEDGVDTATDFFTGTGFTDLGLAAGALGIYIPGTRGANFGNPDHIIDFVQWGASGQPREDTADAAGIWTLGDFVPVGAEGSSIKLVGPAGTSASWCEEPTPSIGMPNSPCVVMGPPEVDDGTDPDGNGTSQPVTVTGDPAAPGECLVGFDEVTPSSGYNVYRGTIAALAAGGYDHDQVASGCGIAGTPYRDDSAGGTSYYYLVVARTADGTEGSYGRDSMGAQRPAVDDPSVGNMRCP